MNQRPPIRDYMASNVVTLSPDMEILRAMELLLEMKFSGAPVVDESGWLVGVLSKKDCLRAALSASYYREWGDTVADYMSSPVETLEADLDIDGLVGGPYRAVFIRAPGVERVGPAVEVLASVDDHPVLCSQGSVLVASFHPELTDDDRLHQRFLSLFLDLAA